MKGFVAGKRARQNQREALVNFCKTLHTLGILRFTDVKDNWEKDDALMGVEAGLMIKELVEWEPNLKDCRITTVTLP